MALAPKKKPKFVNPWELEELPARTAARAQAEAAGPAKFENGGEPYDPATGAVLAPPSVDIVVNGYGGLRVNKAGTHTEAMLVVLEFFVAHRAALDRLLVSHEIVLSQLPEPPSHGFYVHHSKTRWAVMIPMAANRDEAVFQLLQALLEIARSSHGPRLTAAGIHPYRS